MQQARIILAILIGASLVNPSCSKPKDKNSKSDRASAAVGEKTAGGQRPGARQQAPEVGEHHEDHHDEAPQAAPKMPPDGHLGASLTLKAKTPLAKLLAAPKTFEGKKVLIEGKVVAMCRHRRAWFAFGDSKGNPVVMVRTAPRFFVPTEAMGRRAVAEGTVTVKTFPKKMAAHLAKEHKLFGGDPKAIDGPRTLVTIEATGVQFQTKQPAPQSKK